jgi:hypothetical protein
MRINELLADPNSVVADPDLVLMDPDTVEQGFDGEDYSITLTQYSDDDAIPDDLRELSELLVGVESAVQARMILALFFPELEWGGKTV